MGDPWVVGPGFAFAALLMIGSGHLRLALHWFAATVVVAIVCAAIKTSDLSFQTYEIFGHTLHSWSFPSGHATLACAFWGTLALLVWRWFRLALPALLFGGMAFGACIGVYFAVWHKLLDVVAAVPLGCSVPAYVAYAMRARVIRS